MDITRAMGSRGWKSALSNLHLALGIWGGTPPRFFKGGDHRDAWEPQIRSTPAAKAAACAQDDNLKKADGPPALRMTI